MTVYVDNAAYPLGNMIMCHMHADTTEELQAMADRIGLSRRWLQKEGTPDEHYDVSRSKRKRAVHLGALEVTTRHLVSLVQEKRRVQAKKDTAGIIPEAGL